MRILTVVTAALAAGSISFGAMAAGASPRSVSETTKAPERTPLFSSDKPRTTKAEPPQKTRTADVEKPRGKRADRQKAAKASAAVKREERKRGDGPRRQRIVIDTTTTASVPIQGYSLPAGKAFSKYDLYVSRYAATNGVPVSLAHAVIRVESNYRADARGSAGEVGLMQIKPATARMMGYRGSVKGLYDPETNIKYGMKYLGMAHKLGGGATCQTILKYNAGHAARRMNPVSSAYCGKVKRSLAGH